MTEYNILLIFIWVWAAMVAMGIWESSIEGKKPWNLGKIGWKIKIGKKLILTRYHFFAFFVMLPLLITLPLIIIGWDARLFGVLMSAGFSGLNIQDFSWYIFNPKVKIKEFWSSFSDYFFWIRINGVKIIPWNYVVAWIIAIAFWFFMWR